MRKTIRSGGAEGYDHSERLVPSHLARATADSPQPLDDRPPLVSNSFPSQSKLALVVSSYTIADPPTRHACLQLQAEGWAVAVQQLDMGHSIPHQPLPGIEVVDSPVPALPGPFHRLNGPVKFWYYRQNADRLIRRLRPELVVTITLHDLASLPWPPEKYGYKLVCAILDVPVLEDCGKYDRLVIQKAWERIGRADIIWASDVYKAESTQRFGKLPALPLVCHNAPQLDYLPEPTWPRNGWLRAKLRADGARLGETGGCIVLRAGAVGEFGGLEETLNALRELPKDVVLLMMGRPYTEYKSLLGKLIVEFGLQERAFLWDKPSDETWKKALQGADIGHLIHGPFPPGRWQRQYEANSSLSNNRLFQYMAAALPIISYDDPRMADLYSEVPTFGVCRLEHLMEDMRTHIGELAGDPRLRERLGSIGRDAHRKRYYWTAQFAPVLKSILMAAEKS